MTLYWGMCANSHLLAFAVHTSDMSFAVRTSDTLDMRSLIDYLSVRTVIGVYMVDRRSSKAAHGRMLHMVAGMLRVQVCGLQLQHLFTTWRSCNSPARQLHQLEDASLLMSFEDGCVRICDPATAQDAAVTLPQLSVRSPRYVRSGHASL